MTTNNETSIPSTLHLDIVLSSIRIILPLVASFSLSGTSDHPSRLELFHQFLDVRQLFRIDQFWIPRVQLRRSAVSRRIEEWMEEMTDPQEVL